MKHQLTISGHSVILDSSAQVLKDTVAIENLFKTKSLYKITPQGITAQMKRKQRTRNAYKGTHCIPWLVLLIL